jgi:GT2 family glycosyltransferase
VSGDPLLSVIVVAYDREDLLKDCVRSVVEATSAVPGDTETLVVMTGESSSLGKALAGEPVTPLPAPGNPGFAGAVALGIEAARGEWVAVLNDDCVVEPNALRELLLAGTSDRKIGSVAPEVRFARSPGVVNSAGLEVDGLGVGYERSLGSPAANGGHDLVDVFGASGTAALYRREMLDAVGGFDASYFAYLEDVDLAWRARIHGWRAVHTPAAVVWHHHSAAFGHGSDLKYRLVGRNRVRTLAKNATTRQLVVWGPAMLGYDVAYCGYVALKAKTLAPVRGRVRGLAEWRTYRAAGRPYRAAVELSRPAGIRAALARERSYSHESGSEAGVRP